MAVILTIIILYFFIKILLQQNQKALFPYVVTDATGNKVLYRAQTRAESDAYLKRHKGNKKYLWRGTTKVGITGKMQVLDKRKKRQNRKTEFWRNL